MKAGPDREGKRASVAVKTAFTFRAVAAVVALAVAGCTGLVADQGRLPVPAADAHGDGGDEARLDADAGPGPEEGGDGSIPEADTTDAPEAPVIADDLEAFPQEHAEARLCVGHLAWGRRFASRHEEQRRGEQQDRA